MIARGDPWGLNRLSYMVLALESHPACSESALRFMWAPRSCQKYLKSRSVGTGGDSSPEVEKLANLPAMNSPRSSSLLKQSFVQYLGPIS